MESSKLREYHTEEDYYALPDEVRVELINGVFYDMSAPTQLHQEMIGQLYRKIAEYIDSNKGKCKVIPAPFDVKLEDKKDNIVQPDISVICDQDKLDGKRCNGAPDWVIEIASPGSLGNDYVRKLKLYQNAGVKEYWIVNPEDKNVITYHFEKENVYIETYTFDESVKCGLFDRLSISFPKIIEKIMS